MSRKYVVVVKATGRFLENRVNDILVYFGGRK